MHSWCKGINIENRHSKLSSNTERSYKKFTLH